MRIKDEIRKSGIFWLVENEEEKIPGEVTISNGGKIEVEINGLFGGDLQLTKNTFANRIIGKLEDGRLITLDDCYYIERNLSFGGMSKSRIFSNFAMFGAAFEKDEIPTFETLEFSIDSIDEWIGITGISVTRDFEKRTATISYNPIKNLSYKISPTISLEIGFAYTIPGFPVRNEAKITQSTFFKIVSENKISIDELTELAYKITNLVCFATDHILSMKSAVVTSSDLIQELTETESRPLPINLYYQSLPFTEQPIKLRNSEILFNFSSLQDRAENFLKNWIAACDYLAPSLGLYFSVKNGGQKHLEGKFLALAQSLETYHRRTSDEKMMEEKSFSEMIDKIVSGCPQEHAEWLQQRLQFGNEISLRKRLEKIIEPFKEIIGTNTKNKSMIGKIVSTRNYLTHYGEEAKKGAVFGIEMWKLQNKLEAILQLHIMQTIGFTKDEIKFISENCSSLKQKLSS